MERNGLVEANSALSPSAYWDSSGTTLIPHFLIRSPAQLILLFYVIFSNGHINV